MTVFIAGLIIFFGTHVFSIFRSRAPGRDIKDKVGVGLYMSVYAVVSFIGFGLIIWGYKLAPGGPAVFVTPIALRWVSALCLLLGFVCWISSVLPAGQIKRTLKHPQVVAVALWGFAHLLYGGDLVAVLLFGSFFAFGVIGRIGFMLRPDPVFEGEPSMNADAASILVGAGLFFAFVYGLHLWLFGIAPVLPF